MNHTTPQKPTRLLGRTIANLRTAWRDLSAQARGAFRGNIRPDLPDDDAVQLRQQFQDCVEARGGEVAARARAAALGQTYLSLSPAGQRRFLEILAVDFDTDRAKVDAAIDVLHAAQDAKARRTAERALRQVLLPPRRRLLTHFNALPEGVKFLVDLRAELIGMIGDDTTLALLEDDLKALLTAWFDVDFLEMHRITWDSPAALLEKLMAYEAVHEIADWNDLKNRLDSDRRLFAFFHPRMPQEPLIFVEVALVKGLAGNVQALLDENAPVIGPNEADTAIFYSISSAQKGLAGISFGNFLIKRVVDLLRQEFPGLKTFATLSPIPGFRAWLESSLKEGMADMLLPAERAALKVATGGTLGSKGALKALLADPGWPDKPASRDALRAPLMRNCMRYLLEEKSKGARALDPVAHFHLTNGARIERLTWMADRSPKGIEQSAGIMVNYLYRLGEIDSNHEAYTSEGKITTAGAFRMLNAE